ncbi:tetratricopeptide (TPR) repeat protein [Saccharothrix tamanrassetensis]|uniref:Tetratricopeptide (TPR) repeat protein n=1 Tax=Saccharothrix tamanrassetensis TaxID=1051531 RepID=A0A841CHP2_9PSEU|nr:tetratricopeptide repeat protein [Saccharothrix tamanrassetensis]MBB5955884.1 tetratricopeptide (TPR) repeat protein [Saccharothrix tamanrassetensis]
MAKRQRGGPPLTRLQGIREASGKTQDQVVRYLRTRGPQLGVSVASESSLHIMLSRWENGHVEVTEPGYRRLFREFYGRSNEELGFPSDLLNESTEELRDRLVIARSVDRETLDLFQSQVNGIRGSDKRFGAVAALDQLDNLIKQMEQMRSFSTNTEHRKRLAATLTDARTLAGWKALDRGSQTQAWEYHEDAKVSAQQADSPYLLAHAAAQQAVILLDIGEPAAAVELLEYARYVAENRAPSLMQAWLTAAHGEGLAAAGRHDDALRAFDDAHSLLPQDPADPELPFLLLNDAHLSRWRGSALLRLGDHEAIEELEAAAQKLHTSPSSAVRGQVGMFTDLAFAYAAAGDSRMAQEYARKARRLAAQIGSDRQRRRLANLELPESGSP